MRLHSTCVRSWASSSCLPLLCLYPELRCVKARLLRLVQLPIAALATRRLFLRIPTGAGGGGRFAHPLALPDASRMRPVHIVLAGRGARRHAIGMFIVTEAEADAI